jgi:hypothetical protein
MKKIPTTEELLSEAISPDAKIDLQKVIALYRKTIMPGDKKEAAKRERELEVYKMRVADGMTLAQIAKELNISTVRVRQIEMNARRRFNKITDKLKENINEESPATSIGNQSVALPPTARFKTIDVTDKRYRKDRMPVLLKRFRKHWEENA